MYSWKFSLGCVSIPVRAESLPEAIRQLHKQGYSTHGVTAVYLCRQRSFSLVEEADMTACFKEIVLAEERAAKVLKEARLKFASVN